MSRWFGVAARAPSAVIVASVLVLLGGCASSGSGAGSTSTSGSSSAAASPATTTSGIVARTPVGTAPVFAAQDQKTQTLYVTNSGNNTVSVINMALCNSRNVTGCARKWPVIAVGMVPLGIAVDEATNTIYVTNASDGTVSVINGATCNAGNTSGCDKKPTTVRVGAFGDAVTVDPVTNMVFVTNQDAHPGTVSVIKGNSCTGSHPSGCAHQPFTTINVGGGPSGIGVNPVTNTIYVANTGEDSNNVPAPDGNTLSVINGATCKLTDKSGCTPVGTVRVGGAPANVAIDQGANSVYVANTYDNTHSPTGTVSVVNGANCDASNVSGCTSQTPPQVPVGMDPVSTAFDKATDTVYVTNLKNQAVSVINAARCNATQMSGCKARPPSVTVGNGPSWTVINLALHTIYVVDQGANHVAVLSNK
jgi:DNA-binding beta-propeller fold protein YncE